MRKGSIFNFFLFVVLYFFVCLLSLQAETKKTVIIYGGKGFSGPYFPSAHTIAKSVSLNQKEYGFSITIKSRRKAKSIISGMIEGVDYFRNLYPEGSTLTRAQMTENLVAPIHPGTADFYHKSGIYYSLIRP